MRRCQAQVSAESKIASLMIEESVLHVASTSLMRVELSLNLRQGEDESSLKVLPTSGGDPNCAGGKKEARHRTWMGGQSA